jgi:hypothetical protein
VFESDFRYRCYRYPALLVCLETRVEVERRSCGCRLGDLAELEISKMLSNDTGEILPGGSIVDVRFT